MAEVKLKITAEDRASAVIEKMKANGVNASDRLSGAFEALNIKSTAAYDKLRNSATSAYEKIKNSGVATADELSRAQKAHASHMVAIDEDQFGKRTSLLQKFKSNWLGITASIGAAVTATWAMVSKAFDMAQEGAKFKTQGTSFANLAAANGVSADKMIADLNRVAEGTVSVQQLVEKAGTAMLLNVDVKIIPKLMEIAKASSRITGQSVTEAFGDISLGVARQSKLILDNLGIIVDVDKANRNYAAGLGKTSEQLSDVERKQAFVNAILEAGTDIIDKVGAAGDSNADKLARLTAATDNLSKSFSLMISGPVSTLANDFARAFDDVEKMVSGKLSFLEYAFTPADELKKKLEALGKTDFDAGITDEGKALAQRKIEEANRLAAEADKKSKVEAAARAAKDRSEQLEAFRKHNDRILDIEKKRIDQSLNLETAHLQKLTSSYGAAVSAMDSLIDARAAAQDKFSAAKSSVNSTAENADPYTKRLDDLEALAQREQEIRNASQLSAEEKSRQFADLATASAAYKESVVVDGVEIISALDAQATANATILRLEQESALALDTATASRLAARDQISADLQESIMKEAEFKQGIEQIEYALDRINGKEISIAFKATGLNEILRATGAIGSGGSPSTLDTSGGITSTSVADLPTYATGTNYVPRTGLALIHQGERIIPASQNKPGAGGGTVTIAPVINISGVSSTGAEKTARELAREIAPELQKLAARYR